MKLTALRKLTGQIELVSGLHIGSGNTEMHIGGTDNPIIKNPVNGQPYIPGSSLKGKMRSLLEWELGVVGITDGKPLGFGHIEKLSAADQAAAKRLLKLFGGAPEGGDKHQALQALVEEIGPTRLAFWDAPLCAQWVQDMRERSLPLTETKMENMIDRIRGVAEHPRNTERVPAGARFEFALTIRMHDDEALLADIYRGIRLVEYTGLGGSGSRGYGKLRFTDLKLDGEPVQDDYARGALTGAA